MAAYGQQLPKCVLRLGQNKLGAYIYIYIEREREREIERERDVFIRVYIYVCVHRERERDIHFIYIAHIVAVSSLGRDVRV